MSWMCRYRILSISPFVHFAQRITQNLNKYGEKKYKTEKLCLDTYLII